MTNPVGRPRVHLVPTAQPGTRQWVDQHVGRRIGELRRAAGLTGAQLGCRIGVSYQQVYKYESGANRVSAGTLDGIAQALGVKVGAFFPPTKHVASPPVAEVTALAADLSASQLRALVEISRALRKEGDA